MNDPIVITPQEVINTILAVCGAIITISAAMTVIIKAIDKVKQPNKKQDDRLAALEAEVKNINERLIEGDKRFESDADRVLALEASMKETNKVIIESLQALTAHAIDGNNIDELKAAKRRLNSYLAEKL